MKVKIPKLKESVEMHEFDTSRKKKTYILRSDNRQWEISEYVYDVVLLIREKDDAQGVAEALTNKYGIQVSADKIIDTIDNVLMKMGIFEGSYCEYQKTSNKSKYMWLKIEPIKSRYIKKFKFLSVLFSKNIFRILMTIGVAFQLLLLTQFIAQSGFKSLASINADIMIYFIPIGVIATLCHEMGHMTAAMKYGKEPGNIGLAFYFMTPVMYSDVTKIWSLKRKERAVVDVGGMYFEIIVLTIIAIIGIVFDNRYIVMSVSLLIFSMTMNLNPFLKWDGYWLLSDLTGIPNLHKNVVDYSKALVKRVFGEQVVTYIDGIELTERRIFKAYVAFSYFFFIYFIYLFIKISIAVFANVGNLSEVIHYNYAQHTVLEGMHFVGVYVYSNIMTLILMVIIIRIIAISCFGLISFLKSLKIRSEKFYAKNN